MPVRISCPQCSKSLKVPDDSIGKKGKCPQCSHTFVTSLESQPENAPAEPATLLPKSMDETAVDDAPKVSKVVRGAVVKPPKQKKLENADSSSSKRTRRPAVAAPALPPAEFFKTPVDKLINGQIKKVRKSPFYFIAILMVTLCMIVLPLIYVASIAAVGYGVYYHAANHFGMMEYGHGRGKIVVILLYFAPIVVGTILVLFMTKPLFARPSKRVNRRSLDRNFQPVLFQYVDRICEIVGSPKPRRIDVDYLVNASASFRNGMLSFFGSDLVLTIGVPLVAGMSLRQFTGVLAHEFGHFSQGTGMRLSYVSRSINFWFARVVYERDEWDDWLSSTAEETDLRIGWILYLSMMGVGISRGLLWVLMMTGHAISGYLLRQMEYDADRYETRVGGSKSFEQTTLRLQELSLSYNVSMNFIFQHLKAGVAPDDLSKVVLKLNGQIPPKELKKFQKKVGKKKTGFFDSHPADIDRIANSAKENAEGIMIAEGPASQLFYEFEAMSRSITYYLYTSMGAPFSPSEMTPVDEIFKDPTLPSEIVEEESAPTLKLAT